MIKSPFPWFGGKSRAADLIWSRFGADVLNYVEPFFGSGVVWLNRPDWYNGVSVVNDLDGNIANFWRAMKASPDAVAEAANNQVNECDLHARHLWLINNIPNLAERLMADPEYCEPRTAGWWAWGCCCWIGGGWCAGDGSWIAEPDAEGIPTLVKRNAGRGVNRQLPHISNAGMGVNRQLPHIGDAGRGVNEQRLDWLKDWFSVLSNKLRETRVACGYWTRICTPSSMLRFGPCAVLLDPPYSTTDPVYSHDSSTVANDVREWCERNGSNTDLRIALCGHDGEHNALEQQGWQSSTWAKPSGYQGKDTRERIWFSPGCQHIEQRPQLKIA